MFLSWLIGGPAEVRRLLSGFTKWRIGWRWYIAALIFPIGALVIAGFYVLVGNPVDGLEAGATPAVLAGWLAFTLASGPLAEEAGWRGFALPRMEPGFGALGASILIGVLLLPGISRNTAWPATHRCRC